MPGRLFLLLLRFSWAALLLLLWLLYMVEWHFLSSALRRLVGSALLLTLYRGIIFVSVRNFPGGDSCYFSMWVFREWRGVGFMN